MNVHHLRYARAVLAHRSFSRAAEACHVSQPSLSLAVAQLEEELGAPLCTRTTRRIEVTTFGAYITPYLDEALRSLEEITRAAGRFHGTTEAVLRLGLTPLVDAALVKRVIEPFERQWTSGVVVLHECLLDELSRHLAAQELDVICTVRLGPRASGSCDFCSEPLMYLPLGGRTASSAGHGITVRELGAQTFVTTADGCGLTHVVRRLFQRHRVPYRVYPGQALSYDVVEEWVALGIGSGILPASKVKRLASVARPVLTSRGQPACVHYEFRWNTRTPKRPHADAFVRHLQRVVPSLVKGAAAIR